MRATHSHIWTHKVEPYRDNEWEYDMGARRTQKGDKNGAFRIPGPDAFEYTTLATIFSCPDESDNQVMWEHASVHVIVKPPGEMSYSRTPTWAEMCYIKELFWDDTELVVQLHPPKKDYINYHLYTLHLWRPVTIELPLPPWYAV